MTIDTGPALPVAASQSWRQRAVRPRPEVDAGAAERAATDGAYGLAATALDFLVDDDLATAVKEDFERAGGAIDVAHYFD